MISVSNITLYVCLALIVVGLVFSTIAYQSWRSTNKIIEKGLQTEGVVIEVVNRKDKNKRTTGTQAPIVQFKTQKGDVIIYCSTTYTAPCSYYQGQIVLIWYMPENPQEATLKGADAYLLPLVFTGFGMLAFLFGLPTLFKLFINLLYQ
jgi:hypothetical protein